MDSKEVLLKLKLAQNPNSIEGMAKFGITPDKTFGIKIPVLRKMAKEIGVDHNLALELWGLGYRETMILASMIDDLTQVTEQQMESWVNDFSYWEICDQAIMNLFEKKEQAYDKAVEWSLREEEFVKRAGFVMMARLAVSDKKAQDEQFQEFFPHILRGAKDDRNFVKKAVNWAIRQIGKRNLSLNKHTIQLSKEIQSIDSKSAKWIANDALRELLSDPVQKRLSKNSK
ncbi:MAG: DNA alkylation repair protein [Candidatus Heimdallarchaeota archaeon]|nr:DNA alkylation repair protein [Candidatus Heimdallarchaeota archaeon]